jgi:hypothetical protein
VPRQAGSRLSSQTCVPGMARNYVGESPAARFTQNRRLGKRQERRREAGSGGSRTQNCGAMTKSSGTILNSRRLARRVSIRMMRIVKTGYEAWYIRGERARNREALHLRFWDVLCKFGARAEKVTCLTPGGLYGAPGYWSWALRDWR